MASIKDRLKQFEATGPPIKPKPKLVLPNTNHNFTSSNLECKAEAGAYDNANNVYSTVKDPDDVERLTAKLNQNMLRNNSENICGGDAGRINDLQAKIQNLNRTSLSNVNPINKESVEAHNKNKDISPRNCREAPSNSLKIYLDIPKDETDAVKAELTELTQDDDIADDFTYKYYGSIYNLPGLENFIFDESKPVSLDAEQASQVANEPAVKSTGKCEGSFDERDVELKQEKEARVSVNRSASKKLIEEIFNTSVWRNSQNYNDDFIFRPSTDSTSGTDISCMDKSVDSSSTMSSSITNDERRKSSQSLSNKSSRKGLFSGMFKSKRGAKKSSEKEPPHDQGGLDLNHSSPEKSHSVGKQLEGDTDSVELHPKKPLNSIFNRDWLNTLGEGIKKKANVMSELRNFFGHGKGKHTKKKPQKGGTDSSIEGKKIKTIKMSDSEEDVYDDGGVDDMSDENETEFTVPVNEEKADKSKISTKEKSQNVTDNKKGLKLGKKSDMVYDDGGEEDPPSKVEPVPVKLTTQSTERKAILDSSNQKITPSKVMIRNKKIEPAAVCDSIYDNSGDDEEELSSNITAGKKKVNKQSEKYFKINDRIIENQLCPKKSKDKNPEKLSSTESVYTDCDEVDAYSKGELVATKSGEMIQKKKEKQVKTKSSNNSNKLEFKHFFQFSKPNKKENVKDKTKNLIPEKIKEKKPKKKSNLFSTKSALKSEQYDSDADENIEESENREKVNKPNLKNNKNGLEMDEDLLYDDDDDEDDDVRNTDGIMVIEEYASDNLEDVGESVDVKPIQTGHKESDKKCDKQKLSNNLTESGKKWNNERNKKEKVTKELLKSDVNKKKIDLKPTKKTSGNILDIEETYADGDNEAVREIITNVNKKYNSKKIETETKKKNVSHFVEEYQDDCEITTSKEKEIKLIRKEKPENLNLQKQIGPHVQTQESDETYDDDVATPTPTVREIKDRLKKINIIQEEPKKHSMSINKLGAEYNNIMKEMMEKDKRKIPAKITHKDLKPLMPNSKLIQNKETNKAIDNNEMKNKPMEEKNVKKDQVKTCEKAKSKNSKPTWLTSKTVKKVDEDQTYDDDVLPITESSESIKKKEVAKKACKNNKTKAVLVEENRIDASKPTGKFIVKDNTNNKTKEKPKSSKPTSTANKATKITETEDIYDDDDDDVSSVIISLPIISDPKAITKKEDKEIKNNKIMLIEEYQDDLVENTSKDIKKDNCNNVLKDTSSKLKLKWPTTTKNNSFDETYDEDVETIQTENQELQKEINPYKKIEEPKKNTKENYRNKNKFIEEYQDDSNDTVGSESKLAKVQKHKISDVVTTNVEDDYDEEDDIEEYISDVGSSNETDGDKSLNNEANQESSKKTPKLGNIINTELKRRKNNILTNLKNTPANVKINQLKIDKKMKQMNAETYIYDEDDIPSVISETDVVDSILIETDDPILNKLIKKNLAISKNTFKLKDPILLVACAKALKTVYSKQKNYLQINVGELLDVIEYRDDLLLIRNGVGKCGWTSSTNLQIAKSFE